MDLEQQEDLMQQLKAAKADNKALQTRMSEMSSVISRLEAKAEQTRDQSRRLTEYVEKLEKIIAAAAARKCLKKLRKEGYTE